MRKPYSTKTVTLSHDKGKVERAFWLAGALKDAQVMPLLDQLVEASGVKALFPEDSPYKHVNIFDQTGLGTFDISISTELLHELEVRQSLGTDFGCLANLGGIIDYRVQQSEAEMAQFTENMRSNLSLGPAVEDLKKVGSINGLASRAFQNVRTLPHRLAASFSAGISKTVDEFGLSAGDAFLKKAGQSGAIASVVLAPIQAMSVLSREQSRDLVQRVQDISFSDIQPIVTDPVMIACAGLATAAGLAVKGANAGIKQARELRDANAEVRAPRRRRRPSVAGLAI